MKFSEIASRLTGVSCPIFGVSWTAPAAEVTVARRVIAFLEDRRVLFNDDSIETPQYCVKSVLDIRGYLTTEIQQMADGELCANLRGMRAACRKFLDAVDEGGSGRVIRHALDHGHWASWKFGAALGELRGSFGQSIARIAAQNGLDVEDDLARILPASDTDDASPEPRPGRGRR